MREYSIKVCYIRHFSVQEDTKEEAIKKMKQFFEKDLKNGWVNVNDFIFTNEAPNEETHLNNETLSNYAIKFNRWVNENEWEYCGLTFNKDSDIYRKYNKETTNYELLHGMQLHELYRSLKINTK